MPDDDRISGRRAPRTSGRIPYVWVEDTDTGHRYDVPETALRPGMKPVEGYELNWTGRPRHPKHRTDLAGGPADYRSTDSVTPPTTQQPTSGPDSMPVPAVDSEPAADKTTSTKGGRR